MQSPQSARWQQWRNSPGIAARPTQPRPRAHLWTHSPRSPGTCTYAYRCIERQYAIKIINKKRAPPGYLDKFLSREVLTMRRLRHKHVVRFCAAR